MSSLEDFLREFRYHPAVQALVPVDVSMGIPVRAGEKLLYIPFFSYIGKNRCRLACDFFVGCPSGEIYAYQKVPDGGEIRFDENALFVMKQKLLAGEKGLRGWQDIPQGLSGLYRRVSERREYDEYTSDA